MSREGVNNFFGGKSHVDILEIKNGRHFFHEPSEARGHFERGLFLSGDFV